MHICSLPCSGCGGVRICKLPSQALVGCSHVRGTAFRCCHTGAQLLGSCCVSSGTA
jgi:hypothetical protein